jgi:hypothetical protein
MAGGVSYNYQVPGTVPLIRQQGNTCWAAAVAMMINWRKGSQSLTIEQTLAPLGNAPGYPERTSYESLYKNRSSLKSVDYTNIACAAGMKYPSAPVSYSPRKLIELMSSRRSPLMIIVYWPNAGAMTHFNVVTRIYTDPNLDMDMVVFNDPDAGSKEMFFEDFISQMEAAAKKFPVAQTFYW